MWMECMPKTMPFKEYGPIIDELKAAVIERCNAIRFVLQTYHDADIPTSAMNDYTKWLNQASKFNNVTSAMISLMDASYVIFERNNVTTVQTTTHRIYHYWCSSPTLVNGEPDGLLENTIAWTGGVGPWWSRSNKDADWSIGGETYHAIGSITSGVEKIVIDELIRYLNHGYYIAIKDVNTDNTPMTTWSIYNFHNGMGLKNFVYGENAFAS